MNKKHKPKKRIYRNITDDEMLIKADVMRLLFLEELNAFADFDAEFNNAYAVEWNDAIVAARHKGNDKYTRKKMISANAGLRTAWQACKLAFVDLKPVVIKTFRGNAAVYNEFGFNEYYEMTRNQFKVDLFMNNLYTAVLKYRNALIEKGYSQAEVDALPGITENFNTAQLHHDLVVSQRASHTQNRIEALNKVWRFIKRINSASKRVFRNNYAKRELFYIPKKGNTTADED